MILGGLNLTLLLKQLFAFVKLLNSDKGSHQIAAGIACGVILGFTPVFSLQTLLVFVLVFFFRIQLGAAFLTAFFLKFPAYLLDPLFHRVGEKILELESLKPLFTKLYNMPVIPLTRFYNTIVMGSGVITLLFAPFSFFIALYLIKKYREQIVSRFEKTKFWILIKSTSFYKWYAKYDELYG